MTNIERRVTSNGSENKKYVDVLEQDNPIAGQAFGCFSFISPEKILKQKELFFFESFLKNWEMNKSMEKFTQFLNFLSFKYNINIQDINVDFEEFIKDEYKNIINSSVEDDYKTFLDKEEERLQNEFNIKHNFQTNVRGIKSRGNFATIEEAQARSILVRQSDPDFDIFVGPVGVWLPWDPEAYKTGNVEYMEEELNQLAHEKKKNDLLAKNAFNERIRESKEKAIEENKKNAEKFGNKISQDIDENGNLIGVDPKGQFSESNELTIQDIQDKLFKGDNIVVGKTDYGRSQLTNDPFV